MDEGRANVQARACRCALIRNVFSSTEGDEGPQLKKPSIGGGQTINAQAIAQAAIAKYVLDVVIVIVPII